MDHVAHQCIEMQFILELSKTLKCDPRACVAPFFTKMQTANKEYKEGFYDELNSLQETLLKMSKERTMLELLRVSSSRLKEVRSCITPAIQTSSEI